MVFTQNEVAQLRNESFCKQTAAKIVAEKMKTMSLVNPLDLAKKVLAEPEMQGKKEIATKIIAASGGHHNQKELPQKILICSKEIGVSVSFDVDQTISFSKLIVRK